MQSGESLFYLLLSMAVMVTQCVLGMADWAVLVSQWLFAGLLSGSVILSINIHRIHTNSTNGLLFYAWALMASVLNLCTIFLNIQIPWWQQDLLIAGFTMSYLLSIGSWLSGDNPIRFLLCGMVIGLCTLAYPQSLVWIILFIWLLFYMRNFTMRNMWSIISGSILMIWLNYCVLLFAFGTGDAYLASFAGIVSWHLPLGLIKVTSMPLTAWLFLAFTAITLFVCIGGGLFSNVVSSLRTHATMVSTVMLCVALVVFAVYDPLSLSLYLCLASVAAAANLVLIASNINISMMRWWMVFVVIIYILFGFVEYAVNYLLTF